MPDDAELGLALLGMATAGTFALDLGTGAVQPLSPVPAAPASPAPPAPAPDDAAKALEAQRRESDERIEILTQKAASLLRQAQAYTRNAKAEAKAAKKGRK